MGFRELEAFNVALLGKMTMRILKEPNALWVSVLKGIYFPNSDFLQAGKGSRSSWAWSSLLEGRRVVSQGVVWSIGDGRSIIPFVDAWIPGSYGYRLGTHPVTQLQANTKLAEWIDLVTNQSALSEGKAQMVGVVPIPMLTR